MSYAHDDRPVAAGIQKGLHRIGRRMGHLHALRVFRDATDLTASPDLWGKVADAMDRARYFLVVLSPHAVASGWVNKEVAHWLQRRGPDQLLFVVVGGQLEWDEESGRFDPDRSDVALPVLTEPGALPTEPFYVDVSEDAPWDPRAPMFREKVTDLAAPIHGKPKYELASEDLREQRRFRRLRRAAVVGLVLLTVLAVVAATIALVQRQEAINQRNQAIALRLESEAESMLAGARTRDDVRAINGTLAAQQISSTPHPGAALRTLDAMASTEKIIRTGYPYSIPTAANVDDLKRAVETARPVFSMVLSPDGRRIATGGVELRLWDADSGEQVDLPFRSDRGAFALAYSPDGHRIASSNADNSLQLWDADTGMSIGDPLTGHTNLVNRIVFSPDGHRLASASADKSIRVWDLEPRLSGAPLHHDGAVLDVAFSPDGHRLVSGSDDKTVRVWDVDQGELAGEPMRQHGNRVWSVAFSRDGRHIVSGSEGVAPGAGAPSGLTASIILWDAENRMPVGEPLAGHDGVVTSVAFSPDSHRIISGGSDGGLRLWEVETGRQIGPTLLGHTGYVRSVDYGTVDGHGRIASASFDGTVRVWRDDRQGGVGHSWTEPTTPSGAPVDGPMLAMAPDGRRMVRADASLDAMWVLDLDEGSAVPVQRPSAERPSTLVIADFSRDGSRIAFAREDRSIVVIDADSGGVLRVIATGFEGALSSLAFSADARLIAAGGEDKSVQIWDVTSGREVGVPLTGPTGSVSHLVFGPDGRRLAAGEGTSVWIWDVELARPIGGPLQGHEWDITSVMFGADGHRVISHSGDSVAVWDADTARQVARPAASPSFDRFAISPNGKYFVVAEGLDLRRFDALTGEPIGSPMRGHTSVMVSSVAVTGDGRFIVSGGADHELRFWDATTGEQVGEPLKGPDGWIIEIRVAPDGRTVRAVWLDLNNSSGIYIWPGPASWEDELCSKLTEDISREQWSKWVSDKIEYDPPC
ncbi:toll/interleukin-1 receptor domain-containing protein [Rhodococcus sp. NPDC058481]|uniref:toll/interleukin-1 receptor domain-containing protein n=1 Tax=unclassified Rhodococcus (in: high G+C Gram-positive bacteria) TaxID=192944 RepID=UPI003662BDFD